MKGMVKEITRLVFAVARIGVLLFGIGHAFVGVKYYWEANSLASINNLAVGLVFLAVFMLHQLYEIAYGDEEEAGDAEVS